MRVSQIFATLVILARWVLSEYLSTEEKNEVLQLHNDQRRNESASNMALLSWNCKLEEMANIVAETCFYAHSTNDFRTYDANDGAGPTNKGENLAVYGPLYKDDPVRPFTYAVEAWYEEKENFTFATGACKPNEQCGHYTANVWAYTYEIGCARAYCNPVHNWYSGINGVFDVCHYNPGGNIYMNGLPLPIYINGTQCTDCNSELHSKKDVLGCCTGLCLKTTECEVYGDENKCGRSKGNGKYATSDKVVHPPGSYETHPNPNPNAEKEEEESSIDAIVIIAIILTVLVIIGLGVVALVIYRNKSKMLHNKESPNDREEGLADEETKKAENEEDAPQEHNDKQSESVRGSEQGKSDAASNKASTKSGSV